MTLLTFAALYRYVDWDSIVPRLRRADPSTLVAAQAVMIATVVLAATRWGILCRALGLRMSTRLALSLTFSGLFFGQVLPGPLGGDAVRAWLGHRSGLRLQDLLLGLVLDRLIALVAVLLLIGAGIHWLSEVAPPVMVWSLSTVVLAMLGAVVLLVNADRLLRLAGLRSPRLARALALAGALRDALRHRSAGWALLLAFLIHLTTILAIALCAWSLGLPLGLRDCLVIVPITVLAASLPVSINGWGVREGAMVVGCGLYGIAPSDALLLSVLFGLGMLVAALPGGILWLTPRHRR